MSASREKQLRQEQIGQPDPKTAREAQQRKQEKRSGILYGAIALVFVVVALASIVWRSNIISRSATAATIDGMIDRMEAELGYKCTVVATGGLSSSIIPFCRHEIICDDDLLLKGLWYLYQKNR